ncbi:MAG: hypothetical protein ACR2PL_06205 [Dehalococcoidia bacterium]
MEGFFLVIMLSQGDTFLQNPLGNPFANKDIVEFFPTYAPTQLAVAGGFTHLLPWRFILLALAWSVLLSGCGLVIFQWKTRVARGYRRNQSPIAELGHQDGIDAATASRRDLRR